MGQAHPPAPAGRAGRAASLRTRPGPGCRWKGWDRLIPPHTPRAGPARPPGPYKRAVRRLRGFLASSHGSGPVPSGVRRGRAAERAAGVAHRAAGAGAGAPEPPRRLLRRGRVPGAAHGAPRGQRRLPPALLAR